MYLIPEDSGKSLDFQALVPSINVLDAWGLAVLRNTYLSSF